MQRAFAPLVYIFVFLFILSIFLTFGFSGFGGLGNGAMAAGGEFARIGDQTVSNGEFAQMMEAVQNRMTSFGGPMDAQAQSRLAETTYEQILRDFATAKAAQAHGVRVSAGEADAAARKRIDEQIEQVGKGSKPDEIARIRQALYSSINTQAEQRGLLGERLREKLTAEVKPVEVKVAHVLVKTDKRGEAEARRIAEDVARQAKAGADFGKLAEKFSEDEASKKAQGVAGWASAQPQSAPIGKSAKPAAEPAQNFVPEFTAAALLLPKGQVSNVIRTTYGYHVLKALDVRDFQPVIEPEKPAPPKKGEKADPAKAAADAAQKEQEKRQQALDTYKSAAVSTIMEGLISNQKRQLEAQVQPVSNWLKAHLLQAKGDPASGPQVIELLTQAQKANEPAFTLVPQGFAFKLAELRMNQAKAFEEKKEKAKAAEQYEAALALLEKQARRDPEMLFQKGEIHQKLGDKTKALAAYQKAMENSRRNTTVLRRLSDKFKELGRKDLAQQALSREAKQLAAEAAEQKRQQEEFQRMMQEQLAKSKAEGKSGSAPIQVTPNGASTPIKIQVGDKGKAPAGKAAKPEAKEKAPAGP